LERRDRPAESRDHRLSLGVVVTNYNTWALARRCLAHVLAFAEHIDSILVVDDASSEPPPEPLDPRVRLEVNPANLGLVPTLNRALSALGTDLAVVFDSDAYPLGDFTAPVRRAFAADPALALAGFRTVDEAGRPTASSEPEPGVAGLVAGQRLAALGRRLAAPLRRRGPRCRPPRLSVYACAMALRREAFAELGGFDEGFDWLDFDHDLSLRVHRSRWRLAVLDEAVAVHAGGGAPQATSERVVRFYKNRWRLLRKHGKVRRPRLVRALVAARLALELLLLRAVGPALFRRPEVLADKLAGRRAALAHCRREYG
jgi:GT2 family glycosyltransferase